MVEELKKSSRRAGTTGVRKSRYILEEQIGFVLRQVTQRHVVIFGSLMPSGITPTQFSVVNMLDRLGHCSQNQLGRLVSMDAATVKGVIDRLSAKGITQTEQDQNDARQLLVSLTAEGRVLAAECQKAAIKISDETLAPLTTAERKRLLTLLKKVA
ncbi:MarR family winged helix-turn-helix transcriptional regulator [Acidocella aminolytica]|jgi:DNA-binding MarR family transcriptional regulator|uniref:Transcriptional regulator MarR n=1 Tax=Acidocella aminolytica 101 = DSM 11237 TaxID=1120923 RepID=A0A0D6PJT2_9PROT|nr:MarR family transcriptional regulator [Acidocella aminolytica]GAN81044.1 transcriptional regulator MarR [Acidocella aminolytica 101 = DSM 11237]GBQ42754.1 transcriptional regulator [Acidocella aminolytica 101 = DSM 11237]SHF18748.1 DNA-binding transcriptional regulator, MarR family [Acidocella aminolytica 101 = DSM 11237]